MKKVLEQYELQGRYILEAGKKSAKKSMHFHPGKNRYG